MYDGCWIDSSCWTHLTISRSIQFSTTGILKGVACNALSVGMVHIKDPLLLNEKSSRCIGGKWYPLWLSERSFIIYPMSYKRK